MGKIKKRTFEKMASRFDYTYVRDTEGSQVYLKKDGITIESFTGYTKAYFYIYEKHIQKKGVNYVNYK